MKFLIQIILTIILGFILTLFLPFWFVAITAFLVAYLIKTDGFTSFFAGFLGIALLWGLAAWLISNSNDNILLERISGVFSLSPALLLLVTAILGGLLGGFAAATATSLRSLVNPKRRNNNPYRT